MFIFNKNMNWGTNFTDNKFYKQQLSELAIIWLLFENYPIILFVTYIGRALELDVFIVDI